jgi:glutamate--cysteine ligase catalytic subunit
MYLDTYTLARAVDPTYRIDRHPANKYIDCAPDLGATKTGAFEDSSSSDTEGDADGQKTTQPTAADEEKKFKAEFKHLFTPATHYYYAQYLNRAEQQQLRVRERFDACPCPVPAVSHPCVYMDGMAFGMGMCCLQVTMQLADLPQARHVYDQLAVVCPAFLALSSATPVQKGMLCDSDVRWLTISASVDDRKRDEVPRIVKSRYDHISCFISDRTRHLESFNDDHVEMDPTVLERLKAHGIDERLASHFAHLFIRDPLVIFDKLIDVDDTKTSVHFENIQSTNWQSLRFKPPPMEGGPGWRVEFRVMDIQLTPFENAAFSVFITLLTRAFIKYDAFLYVPMSMVDENMGRAHLRDPVKTQKFWARKSNLYTDAKPSTDDYAEYTIDELFNGTPEGPEGYIPMVRRFIVEELTNGGPVPPRLDAYLRLLSRRASGELQTTASFLRTFVMQHPAYQHDSIVAPEIACDMVKLAEALSRGEVAFDGFLPQDLVMEARKRERE